MDSMILFPLAVDWPLADVWGSSIGFIAIMIIAFGAIGLLSRRLTVAIWGSYMAFSYYATETGIAILETTLYVTLTLVVIGTVFKLWRSEVVGETT